VAFYQAACVDRSLIRGRLEYYGGGWVGKMKEEPKNSSDRDSFNGCPAKA
jgi:hypothetical protein